MVGMKRLSCSHGASQNGAQPTKPQHRQHGGASCSGHSVSFSAGMTTFPGDQSMQLREPRTKRARFVIRTKLTRICAGMAAIEPAHELVARPPVRAVRISSGPPRSLRISMRRARRSPPPRDQHPVAIVKRAIREHIFEPAICLEPQLRPDLHYAAQVIVTSE